jgi:hypothetical protein
MAFYISGKSDTFASLFLLKLYGFANTQSATIVVPLAPALHKFLGADIGAASSGFH